MDYFPVFINLKDQDCLVIGAGEIAARKIELLARAGAKITVIANKISQHVSSLEASCHLNVVQKSFSPEDLRSFRLVVSATDNKVTNQLVAKTAGEQNILVNVVDNPDLCSFIFPAIIDRSPIVAAVSSGGAAPILARLLRAKIESIIPPLMDGWRTLRKSLELMLKHILKNLLNAEFSGRISFKARLLNWFSQAMNKVQNNNYSKLLVNKKTL